MRRPLVIVGPPASCKSDFARHLSDCTGRLVLNADATTLERYWATPEAPIIDLSGEAWLDRNLRVDAIDRCVVVSVAPAEGPDGTFTEGFGANIEARLWQVAGQALRETHHQVQIDPESLERCTQEVLDLWRRDPIGVAVGERSYLVDVGRGIAESRLSHLLGASAATLVITDSNVDRLYGERLTDVLLTSGSRVVKVVFDAGEEQKNLQTLAKIFEAAQAGGIDRSSSVVAIGGGVVTDVAGFAAATWMRGLRWFGISTTLLGMVDAAVGGKTAVDFGEGKNAVGAFWQPSGVVCDTEWLSTESPRNFTSALAEVVKTAVVGDPELLELLGTHSEAILCRDAEMMAEVVRRCIRVKARIVGLDETEQGLRATLNLGHTVGHALEAQQGYGRWSHGEAVSLGLVAALRLGERLGFTPAEVSNKVIGVQRKLGLPVSLDEANLRQAAELLGHDKKRSGSRIRFVVVQEVGEVRHRWLVVEDLRELVAGLSR